VNVSVEFVHKAKVFGYPDKPFHGIIGIADDSGAEEESFDIVASVEINGEVYNFGHGESCAGDVIALSVNTIGTIVDAVIGKQDF